MTWSIGVDIGGTFTDFFAHHRATGEVRLAKRPSTRDNPGRALLAGLGERGPEQIAADELSGKFSSRYLKLHYGTE